MGTASNISRRETIEHLSRQLHRLERSRCRSVLDSGQAAVSTGVEALDRLFPSGGLCGGTLVECLAGGTGSGAGMLSFVLARQFIAGGEDEHRTLNIEHRTLNREPRTTDNGQRTTSDSRLSALDSRPGPVIVIDPEGEFYPPAMTGLGIDLDETIVVRPADRREVLWALEQSLRCPGVAVTLVRLDRFHKLDSRSFRRLALAAETGGGLGLLLRPAACQRVPSWAHIRLLVQPAPGCPKKGSDPFGRGPDPFFGQSASRRLHIHLLRGRKGHVAESLELELRDEPPDPVHLVAPLADPAPAVRATGT